MGLTLPRLHIADIHLVYNLLVGLKEVDPERVGISGLSGGGTLTYLTAAFDTRFKAAAVFCGTGSYQDYAMDGGCGMQVVPGWFPYGDTSEIFSMIAPRPLLVAQGRLDATFNVIRTAEMVNRARSAYSAAGAPQRIQFETPELAHEYDADLAAEFFLRWI